MHNIQKFIVQNYTHIKIVARSNYYLGVGIHRKKLKFMILNTYLFHYSFFEKISTGSNTDSDLRVVRFDGGVAKEREMIDTAEAMDEDDMPKFKKPALSKYQISQ